MVYHTNYINNANNANNVNNANNEINENNYNSLIIVIILITIIMIVVITFNYYNCNYKNRENEEKFSGALQSLYSNDGIQDRYLTVNNEINCHNDYAFWDEEIVWNLPTRNLTREVFYPYLYEYHVDRYSMPYPYW